jgi:hypothetical protein
VPDGEEKRELDPKPGGEDERDLGSEVLRGLGHVVLPILLTAGGLVGFVALAGGAVVWTRFSAAEVPPDQVVAVYPRAELVAIASALLLLFGLVGLLAVGLCYLIDPKGRASLGMTRVLLTVMGVEGLAVILLIAEARSWQQRIIAAELFVLFVFACFCATSLFEKPGIRKGGHDEPTLEALRKRFFWRTIATGLVVLILALAVMVVRGFDAKVVIAALALCSTPAFWLAWTLRRRSEEPEKDPPGERRQLDPFQVPFTRDGMGWIICLTVAAVVLPAMILKSAWLLLSLAVAAFLFAALWRAALLPKKAFLWYGIAVFVSVPLFGTLTWMAQNVFEPQVQPMALIRKAGDIDEYLQGLYVTETDDRVYFATVDTKGCSRHLVPGSGRLLSVPKSEIAAIAIGPLQNVTRARKAALEMAYALAPSAVIRAPQASPASNAASAQVRPHRLENVAAAVEPIFGAGLHLVPETAAPGQVVTLRMSAPSEKTRGFGRSRHHRTLRVDGIPVKVIKEQAQNPWEAEYVRAEGGMILKLGKQIVYSRVNGVYNAISRYDNPGGHPLFVRLSDKSVLATRVYSPARHAYISTDTGYLRLERQKNASLRLAEKFGRPPRVTLRDGKTVTLEPVLLRQNWHEDHVKFRLPEGARTGRVTIDCDQLANQPYLWVTEPRKATSGGSS